MVRYVLLIIVVLLLAGVGRLFVGPVESDWVRDAVLSRIQPHIGPGNDLTVGSIAVDVFNKDGLKVVAQQILLSSWSSKSSVHAPRINITLDRSALLQGRFVLRDIDVIEPRLETELSGEQADMPEMSAMSAAAERALAIAGETLKQYGLKKISIVGGEVSLSGDRDWKFTNVDIDVEGNAQKLVVAGAFGEAGARRRVNLERTKDAQTGEIDVVLFTPEVVAADFLPVDMEARRGRGLGLPLSIRYAGRFTAEETFSEAMLNVAVGAGFLSFSPEDSISIDRIVADVRWRQGEGRTLVPKLKIVSGRTTFDFRGYAEPFDDTGPERWKIAFQALNSSVGPSDVGGAVLNLDNLYVSALADLKNRNIEFEAIGGRVGPSRISGVGYLDLSEGGPWLSLAGDVDPMPIESVKRLWPSMISPKTRRWFISHISGGQLLGGKLDVVLNGLAFDGDPRTPGYREDGVALDFAFEGTTLHGIGDLPPVTEMRGAAAIESAGFFVNVADGLVRKPVDKDVVVEAASFSIPDIRAEDKEAVLSLKLAGEAIDIGTALDQKPILMGARMGADPAKLSGTAELTINTAFPLENTGDIGQFDWSIQGAVENFASGETIGGQTIEEANLTLEVTPERAVIKGDGRLNGLKAEIDVVQPLRETDKETGRQDVALSITAKDLKENGIDLKGLVSGPIKVSVNVHSDDAKEVSADLTDAVLNLASVGWKKGKGVPAKVSFRLIENGQELRLEDFVLTSDGVRISGMIDAHADRGLTGATFDQFAFRQGDDATLTVKQLAQGYEINLAARRFDGRGIVQSLKTAGEDDSGDLADRVILSARIDVLTGFNKISLFDVSVKFDLSNDVVQSGSITGRLDDKAPLTVSISPSGDSRILQVNTADAGKLLAFLDIYEKMRGGTGILTALLDELDNGSGQARLTDISIENDETVKELVGRQRREEKTIRGTEIIIQRAAETGTADFTIMEMDFNLRDDLLIVNDAILKGPVLGGTASGELDLAARNIRLSGTFVPIYAVNSLFGKLPVIGQIVGGGRNGGLFGVTFALTGSLDDPQLRINPVSAIAPGIFRKIFEYR